MELQRELMEPGTMIIAKLGTFGEEAASEIPTGSVGEAQSNVVPVDGISLRTAPSGKVMGR